MIVTFYAAWQKIFSDIPKIGFLKQAEVMKEAAASGKLPPTVPTMEAAHRLVFNNTLNAYLTAIFMLIILGVLIDAMRIWYKAIKSEKPLETAEEPFIQTKLGEV
jgi:carbon starvation protein